MYIYTCHVCHVCAEIHSLPFTAIQSRYLYSTCLLKYTIVSSPSVPLLCLQNHASTFLPPIIPRNQPPSISHSISIRGSLAPGLLQEPGRPHAKSPEHSGCDHPSGLQGSGSISFCGFCHYQCLNNVCCT